MVARTVRDREVVSSNLTTPTKRSDMRIPTLIVILCIIMFYLVLPTTFFLLIKRKRLLDLIFFLFFIAFIAILIVCTIGKIEINRDFSTLHFDFSYKWCEKSINWLPYTKSITDFLINISMLFPVGLFIFTISSKKSWQKLLICLCIGAAFGTLIESYQFILPVARSVQLSDVLLNSISSLLGGLYAYFLTFIKKK